jgi:hypothetical protein
VSTPIKGEAPDTDAAGEQYLLKKLEDVRKDCQWILGLGAVNVMGVVLKDGFGSASPGLRLTTALVSGLQITVSMVASMTWSVTIVNKSEYFETLLRRLRVRYALRNTSVLLLGVSLILIVTLAWTAASK